MASQAGAGARSTGRKPWRTIEPKAPLARGQAGTRIRCYLTDGESRIMPSPDGFAQCYNDSVEELVDVDE